MKTLLIFVILIAIVNCEVEIPKEYLKAKSVGEFLTGKVENVEIEKRISSGNPVPLGMYPFFTLIYLQFNLNIYQCGGSLIKHEWVLTAAHCFNPTFTIDNSYLGIAQRNITADASYYAQWSSGPIPRSSLYGHESYLESNFQNDIGLMKIPLTKATLDSLPNVAVGRLPSFAEAKISLVGSAGTAIGFGITEYGNFSTFLRAVNLQIISNEDCMNVLGLANYIRSSNICTSKQGSRTVCQGDGGGALYVSINSTQKISGIVSFTANDCSANLPGVYTRVGDYLTWISNIAGKDVVEGSSSMAIKISLLLMTFGVLLSSFI